MTLTGHRVESVRVELLTHTDQSLGFLDGVAGGNLSWNANATLPGGGNLMLREQFQEINPSSDRLRIWWQVQGYGEWPLGVYVLAAPFTQYSGEGRSRNLFLIDKLTVVKDDLLTETLQIPAGSNVVEAATAVIQSTGETRIAATASAATLKNDLTWYPGTSKLTVINDMLTAYGYWGLWTDRHGQFRIEPYTSPSERPETWAFKEGEASIHLPEWSYELPLWEATNQVVMISQADEFDNVMIAYATDDNPDSPTSTVTMKRILNPIVEENVEASSQQDLQEQADRKLINNSNKVGKLAVSHAPVEIWYNDAVRFVSQGMDTKATVTKMSLDLTPGALVQAEWRQA